MKKILKIMLLFFLIVPTIVANASDYSDKFIERYKWIPNDFIIKQKGSIKKYQQLSVIVRESDKQFVYCVEPGVSIDKNKVYIGSDVNQPYLSNMTEEQWNKILLISYYGYGYSDNNVDHTALKWYSVTQFMIWQVSPNGYDIYFTDKLNGKRVTKYTNEINEIEELIANHYKVPNFNTNDLKINIANEIRIKDNNQVLSSWNVNSNDISNVYIDGNDLVIKPNNIGSSKITLTKSDKKNLSPAILYYDPVSQNLLKSGRYDPLKLELNLEIVGGKVEINKLDFDCNCNNPSGNATLSNAKYGIYDKDEKLIEVLITDEKGHAVSNYLPYFGEYTIKELEPSTGYNLDDEVYSFIIDENNTFKTINVYEKVIKGKINIQKVLKNVNTEITIPEPNVKFGLYNENNELIKELITNESGKINIELPYGKYVLKQLTTTNGYKFSQNYIFEIKTNNQVIDKKIINEEISAKLKVIKIDKDTGNQIKSKNIKFKIKNLDLNEYVNQDNSEIFYTNEEGIMITKYPLGHGNYSLEEVDSIIDGYLWNKESVRFTIDENSNFYNDGSNVIFETKFENKVVKSNIKLIKYGEQFEIKDNNLFFYNKVLPDIKFGLYAREDIFDGTGKLIYKKDELISIKQTDQDGKILFADLYLGKYYIKEISLLNDYVKNDQVYEINLEYQDQYTEIISYELKVYNLLKHGELEFTKTDFATSEAIPNTKIEIYTDKDELIFSGITDDYGKVTIKKLPLGKYYIVETKPSTGYRLTNDKIYFEIKENNEVVKANMTNEKIEIEVPNTENNNYLVPILMISIIVSSGIILYEKVRKNKKK